MRYSLESKYRKYDKDMAFCHLLKKLEIDMEKN